MVESIMTNKFAAALQKRVGVAGSKLAVVMEWYENAKDSLCFVKFR